MMNAIEPPTSTPNQSLEQATGEFYDRSLNSLFFFCRSSLGMKDLTPTLHGEYCDFMQSDVWIRKISMMARAHLKTWVGTIGDTLHRATRFLEGKDELSQSYAEFPILIMMSTAGNSRRISREMARVFDEAPVFHWLHPNIVPGDEWSKDVRMLDFIDSSGRRLRRVTIDFKGVEARISSNHYRLLKLDDIHAAEEAMDSPPSVTTVVSRYEHSDSLVIEPLKDPIHLIGSPCSLHPPDVYESIKAKELDRYTWFVRPCYNKAKFSPHLADGEPAWPERFPRNVLEAIRRKEGDVKFSYQYLLDPIDELVAEFRMSDFVRFGMFNDARGSIYITEDKTRYELGDLFAFSTVDLAGWRGEGDSNAILTGGTAADGRTLLLDEFKKRCPPDVLIDAIVDHHKRYYTSVIGVEEVAYQECLSWYLEKRIRDDHLNLRVVPCKPQGKKKPVRIRNMQPSVRERRFLIHEGLVLFMDEAGHFPKGENHLLDCLAYIPQVSNVPMRDLLEEREARERRAYLRSIGEEDTMSDAAYGG